MPNPVSNQMMAAISIQNNPFSLMAWTSALILCMLAAPALSVIVFLRRTFGTRFIKLWMVSICFGLLWSLFSLYGKSYSSATPARFFGVAMMALAIWHSRAAWRRLWKAIGEDGQPARPDLLWHSMNDGRSWLRTFFPKLFPPTIKGERLLKVIAEPALVATTGVVCLFIGFSATKFSLSALSIHSAANVPGFGPGMVLLAYWLLLAAVTLSLFEAMLFEQRLNSLLDQLDMEIVATSMLGLDVNTNGTTPPASPVETLGNPVVFTPELYKLMEAAREKGRANERARATAA